MRNIIYGGGNSLDNYLARPDHSVDWLKWGDEAAAITTEFWKHVDTVLMGRKTYDFAVRNGMGGGYPGMQTFVFSRSLAQAMDGVTLVRDDAAEFVRALKDKPGKDICLMGGGELARTMFEADLIDEVGFNIHPLLLGSGIPAFHQMTRQIDLELKECREFTNGCVYVYYKVKRQASAGGR